MIRDFIIRDNKNLPRRYASKLRAFRNGKEYHFEPGVNVIIGKNGSGKTTLVEMIKAYLWMDMDECGDGLYGSTASKLLNTYELRDDCSIRDGADLTADYDKNSFCLVPVEDYLLENNANGIFNYASSAGMSDGERTNYEMGVLINKMFSGKTNLKFDYGRVAKRFPKYGEYMKRNRVEGDEFTVFMDEPDSSLDIENVKTLYNILSFHKPQTQLIAIVHNPFLIDMLSKVECVHFIEMTRGYKNYVCKTLKELRK